MSHSSPTFKPYNQQSIKNAVIAPTSVPSVFVVTQPRLQYLPKIGLFVDQTTAADDLLTQYFAQTPSILDWKISLQPPRADPTISVDATITQTSGQTSPSFRILKTHPLNGKFQLTAGKTQVSLFADTLNLGGIANLTGTLNLPYKTSEEKAWFPNSAVVEAKVPKLGVSGSITHSFINGTNSGDISVFHAVQVAAGPIIGVGIKTNFSDANLTSAQIANTLSRGNLKAVGSLNFTNFASRPSTIGLNALLSNQLFLNRLLDVGFKTDYKLEGVQRPNFSVAVLDRASNMKFRIRTEGVFGVASTVKFDTLQLSLGLDLSAKGAAFNVQLTF